MSDTRPADGPGAPVAADAHGDVEADDVDLAWCLDEHGLHLTAPIVSPRISCFCAIQPASRTGRLASVAAAASFA